MYQGNGTNIIMNSHKHVWLSIIYFDILVAQTPKTYSPKYIESKRWTSSLMVFKFIPHFTRNQPLYTTFIIARSVLGLPTDSTNHHRCQSASPPNPTGNMWLRRCRYGIYVFCRYMGKVCRGVLRLLRTVMTFDGTLARRGHASFMCTYFYILTEKVVFHTCPWRSYQES